MRSTLCSRCRPLAGLTRKQVLRSAAQRQIRCESTSSDVSLGQEQPVAEAPKKKRNIVFSGIQPTGIPHLGNYLGALRQWKKLQDDVQSSGSGDKLLFSIVDLHAITMPQDAPVLRLRRREMLAVLLAIGLDPEKGSTIFFQSSIPQHTELMWILSCTASMGYLSRMTQWKSKLTMENKQAGINDEAMNRLKLGLFSYPVLQAADILVHRATHVPVGEDQRQHLEFARECATNFNHNFKDILIPPETMTTTFATRVMSLTNPRNKMSKSTPNHRSRILITASPSQIRSRIVGAITDNQFTVSYDPEARPGVANLLELLSQCGGYSASASDSASASSYAPLIDEGAEGVRVDDGDGGRGEGEGEGGGGADGSKGPRYILPWKLAEQYVGKTLKDLKHDVANAVCSELDGVADRFDDYLHRKGGKWLDEIAAEGAEVARANAEATMRQVRYAVGLSSKPR